MKYENLEEKYDKIFNKKVLPFIRKNIDKDFYSLPVYHLLEGLNTNRFRSGLPIIVAREFNIDENKMIPLSAFCELTFTTAMAQDDYYDNDKSREGLIPSHKKFGTGHTLLSCDYINHKIFSILINELEKNNFDAEIKNRVIKILNKGLSLGYLSVLMEFNSKKDLFSIDEDFIKKIYLYKTIHGRMLLECSFLLAQEKIDNFLIIKKYAEHIAIAGQLKNDIYDFTKHKKYRGLSDLKQGHITWPLFLLINSLSKKEKKIFLEYMNDKNFDELIKLFREKQIIEKTIQLINFNVEKAKEIIKGKFPEKIEFLLNLWAEGNRHFSKEPRI
jgi:geranylgeranyl pyrophosphate synthase